MFAWSGVSTWAPSFLARSFGMTTLEIGGWLAYALLSVTVAWLWSAVPFALSGRTLKADGEKARLQNAAA